MANSFAVFRCLDKMNACTDQVSPPMEQISVTVSVRGSKIESVSHRIDSTGC